MRSWKRVSWLAPLVVVCGMLYGGLDATAGEYFMRVTKVTDLPDIFDPEIPLYVKGTVPLNEAAFTDAELEHLGKRLYDENAKRAQKFIGVLIGDHRGERFVYDNREYVDSSATLVALDSGMNSNDAFIENDFALLIIHFTPSPFQTVTDGEPVRYRGGAKRPFRYLASKKLKSHRMGVPDIWEHDVQNYILNRLKSGQVKQALYETADYLNDRLEETIRVEEERKAEVERSAKQSVADAGEKLAALKVAISTFTESYPKAVGQISSPNKLSSVEASQANAEAAIAAADYSRAATHVGPVLAFIDEHGRLLSQYPAAIQRLKTASEKLVSRQTREFAEATKALYAVAIKDVTTANQSTSYGDLDYLNHVAAAETAVDNFVNTHQRLVSGYEDAEQTLEAAVAKLAQLRKRDFAEAAYLAFKEADSSISDAKEALNEQTIDYPEKVDTAVSDVDSAENIIAAALSRHRTWVAIWTVLSLVTLAIIAGVSFYLRKQSQTYKRIFEARHKSWKNLIGEKDSAAKALNTRKKAIIGANQGENSFLGVTKEKADRAGKLIGRVIVRLNCSRVVLQKAVDAASPRGLWQQIEFAFSADPYKKAIAILEEETIQFGRETGLHFVLGGKEIKPEEALYSSNPDEFFFVEKTFALLNAEIANYTSEASALLDAVKEADDQATSFIVRLQQTVAATEAHYSEACEKFGEDGVFVLNSYTDKLVPALEEALSAALELSTRDPLTAKSDADALVPRVEATVDTVDQVFQVASNHYESLAAKHHTLAQHKLDANWVKNAFGKIVAACDRYMSDLAAGPPAISKRCSVLEDTKALYTQVHGICVEAKKLREVLEPSIAKAEKSVTETRQSLAASLSLAAEEVLTESIDGEELDPSTLLKRATHFAGASAVELEEGDLDAAKAAISKATKKVTAANKLVTDTVAAFEAFEARKAKIVARGAELEQSRPRHYEILEGIRTSYHGDVLLLGAGDLTNPRANNTVDDNLDEVATLTTERETELAEAVELLERGEVLLATTCLESAEACNSIATDRLEEIVAKQTRLQETITRNAESRDTLQAARVKLLGLISDQRVMAATDSMFDRSREALADACAMFDEEKPNPFAIEIALANASQMLNSAEERRRLDLELHSEAVRSVRAAEKQLRTTNRAGGSVFGMADKIPDSTELKQAKAELKKLEAELVKARALLEEEHGDWDAVDSIADNVTNAAQRLLGVIKGEAREGEQAVEQIRRANRKVREAINWSGSYGVSLYGSPGSNDLAQARAQLDRGDYDDAISYAERAYSAASSAIAKAEADVARKRREEEERRRRERERRRRAEEAAAAARRAAARRRSSSSSSFSSGGSSGFGGFSSSGGSGGGGGFTSSGGSGGW